MKRINTNTRILTLPIMILTAGSVVFILFIVPTGLTDQNEGILNDETSMPLTRDASFEIQEANVSIVKYVNSTPVSYEQLQIYPELERSLHGVDNDPAAWRQGWRLVKNFEGNISLYNAFVDDVCKGRSRIECNGGMLFEYHGQFYSIRYNEYGYHTLAGCERGNYNCT